ncbi:MAG: hypothetical protein AAFY99_06990 [Pseudomonadota bacterium]
MVKSLKVWGTIVLLFGLFLAWHQPWGKPLDEEEVVLAFTSVMDAVTPSDAGIPGAAMEFFMSDDGRPFYMINLNKFEPGAVNPSEADEKGQAANEAKRRYGLYMLRSLLARASYPVLSVPRIQTLANSFEADSIDFDYLTVVRYRSRRDLLRIITTTEFQEVVQNKFASLEAFSASPAEIGPTFSLPRLVAIVLLLIGAVGHYFIGRKRLMGETSA